MKTKTQITPELLKQVQGLSEQGMNNIQISKSLNISVSTLSRNNQLKQAIQEGKLKLSYKVTQSVLDTLEDNASTQQLLIKRLCLFNPVVNIVKPTNAKQALANLATATKQYANGLINESQLRTIEAVSNSYVKGHEVTDLEERLQALETLQGSK